MAKLMQVKEDDFNVMAIPLGHKLKILKRIKELKPIPKPKIPPPTNLGPITTTQPDPKQPSLVKPGLGAKTSTSDCEKDVQSKGGNPTMVSAGGNLQICSSVTFIQPYAGIDGERRDGRGEENRSVEEECTLRGVHNNSRKPRLP